MINSETVIIGGGPSGSAAAIHLARQGMPVRLFDRQAEPHHKVCGEFISFEAAHHLTNLGLDLSALGAVPIRRVRFFNGEAELEFDLPFTAWSLSRYVLDAALLKQAEAVGAKVELGTAVRKLSQVNDAWELITSNRNASVHTSTALTAKTVFLASGKHELRDWQRNVKKANTNVIGLKMHFSSGSSLQSQWRETVEIYLFDGGYAGLEPIEGGGVNLCFLIRQDIYKACAGNWLAVLEWLGSTSSHMQQRLANLTPLWPEPLAVAGVPYGYIASPADAIPNLFRLGDQTAVIPSFAGDGIAIALHTAALAARVHSSGGDAGSYQREAWRDLTPPVRNARLLANIMARHAARNTAFTFALLWPKVIRDKLLGQLTLRTRVGLKR